MALPRLLRLSTRVLLPSTLYLVSACNYCSSYIRPEQYAGIVVRKHIVRSNRNTHVVTMKARNQKYYIETIYEDILNLNTYIVCC